MIKRKNYYEILGVTPDSSTAEIKAAYRKLARKYHPDVNPDSAERFKDITEAYEILSNNSQRNKYDTLNGFFKSEKTTTSSQKAEEEYRPKNNNSQTQHNFKNKNLNSKNKSYNKNFSSKFSEIFKDFKKNSSKHEKLKPVNGENVYADVSITLSEAVNGTSRTINIMHTSHCPLCKGRKFINGAKCSVCSGKGEVSDYKKITVKIPKNIKDGAKLRLQGEGNQGKFGGKNGDLYINVIIKNNSKIKYDGLNILYNIPITPYEAALGGNISVPTFEGNVSIKLPAYTNSGQKFRLAGQGLVQNGKIGDLIVTVHIEIPCSLSDDEVKLYEKLRKLSQNNIRENLFNE